MLFEQGAEPHDDAAVQITDGAHANDAAGHELVAEVVVGELLQLLRRDESRRIQH